MSMRSTILESDGSSRFAPAPPCGQTTSTQEGAKRLAFEIKGDAIKRIPPQYRIHGDTPQTWWVPDGSEISLTTLANGLHLELTPDLLDGCERSAQRFATFIAEFHDMCTADVGRLYHALAGMMLPRD